MIIEHSTELFSYLMLRNLSKKMPRNVEIKAKIQDYAKLVNVAKKLSKSDGVIIEQEDVFFNVPNGRLKLRFLKGTDSQLVYYERPDGEGPKLSNYSIAPTPYPNELLQSLKLAVGIKGVVKKTRTLFLVDQTRVHVDKVEGLGDYMELEVVLNPEQSVEEGQLIAEDLMKKLDIKECDLVKGAYFDLLTKE